MRTTRFWNNLHQVCSNRQIGKLQHIQQQQKCYVILCMKCHVLCTYQQRENETNCHNENNLEIKYNNR